MEVFEAVRTVLAVRAFQDKAVPAATVRRIVEAGWLTGSSMNGQPWHFLVVEERALLRQLGDLAKTGPYIAQAPLAIVVLIESSPYAVSDASRAIRIHGVDGVGGGRRLQLGGLPWAGRGQAAPGDSG